MTSIVLLCPSIAGHHQAYLRHFTRVLARRDVELAVITPEARQFESWVQTEFRASSQRVRTFELGYKSRLHLPGILATWADRVDWVRFAAHRIAEARLQPDLVFHTMLDYCLTPGLPAPLTDWLFPYRWSGLYFHPWYLRRPMRYNALRRGLLANHAALHSRRCPAVCVLDEGIADKLRGLLGSKPVIVFPDIADDTAPDPNDLLAAQIRERAGMRPIISLLGILTRRKGMLLMMEAAQQMAAEDAFFVFAGPYDPAHFSVQERARFDSFVAAKPENCYFHFDTIPDGAQFNALVALSDVLFAVYMDFLSSSNLLTKAALFHKPLLVSDAALMGERVRAYGMGLAINEHRVEDCVTALHQLTRGTTLHTARYDDYARLHLPAQLEQSFAELLTAAGLS